MFCVGFCNYKALTLKDDWKQEDKKKDKFVIEEMDNEDAIS